MTTATNRANLRVVRGDSEWLYRLLDEVRKEVAELPSDQTVASMRARLASEIGTPVRAAA